MGLLWEMHQQNQRRQGAVQAATLDDRIDQLEARVEAQDKLIGELVHRLEASLGEDLNGDGLVSRFADRAT